MSQPKNEGHNGNNDLYWVVKEMSSILYENLKG